jgi:hypothetical protein
MHPTPTPCDRPRCAGPLPLAGLSRREFLNRFGLGLGGIALSQLLNPFALGTSTGITSPVGAPHLAPKARRIIYLFMAGGPSQLETFDYKPLLNERNGQELPDSVRMGQRLTGMSGNQATLPLAGSIFKFQQHGQSGAWVSELLPHTASIIDNLCIVRSLYTEAINHDPAITFLQTGSQLSGRPSMGAWLSYGLGSTMRTSPPSSFSSPPAKPTSPSTPASGAAGSSPPNIRASSSAPATTRSFTSTTRPGFPPAAAAHARSARDLLHQTQMEQTSDPEIEARIAQYEMAFRMQTSCPMPSIRLPRTGQSYESYGPDVHKPGPSPATASWPAASPNAASSSSSSTTKAGISTATSPKASQPNAVRPTSPPPR